MSRQFINVKVQTQETLTLMIEFGTGLKITLAT